MAGRPGEVLLRIASAGALVVLLAAGCGGSAPRHGAAPRGIPRELARTWAARADTIASVAAAGQSCRAHALAASLRDDVIAAEAKVPTRLQSALVAGVNSLADRIECNPAPVTVTTPPPKPPKRGHHRPPGHGHHKPFHRKHDHPHGHGHGGKGKEG
jgi:hypothetical protein